MPKKRVVLGTIPTKDWNWVFKGEDGYFHVKKVAMWALISNGDKPPTVTGMCSDNSFCSDHKGFSGYICEGSVKESLYMWPECEERYN